jgi:ribonuclease P protein component
VRRFDRLRRAGEIAFLRRKGRPMHFATFSAFAAAPSSDGAVRIGIVASKAVGGAVVRNRVKRRIRGALDALAAPPTNRLLFVAKPIAGSASYAALAADVAEAVSRASVRPASAPPSRRR